MTIAELMTALQQYPGDRLVYVPHFDRTLQAVTEVRPLTHLNLPPGISIPDDVVLLPAELPYSC